MTPLHLLLAVVVIFIWGTNFVVIKLGLAVLPPLAFATLRFLFSAVPWLLFIKRPAVPWRTLALFGTLLGGGMFGLLFLAMRADISPGLASLVVQVQVFFTIGLSMLVLAERVRMFQVAALALSVGGLGVILAHVGGAVSYKGLLLTLAAALSWGCANFVAKTAGRVDVLGFMVWSSLFAVPPLLAASLWLEGWHAIALGLRQADFGVWCAVAWQAIGNTLFGFGVWNWLLARYSAATVTPLALLVPAFGMGASTLMLGEPLQQWKIAAGLLVIGGLTLNLLWPRWQAARA